MDIHSIIDAVLLTAIRAASPATSSTGTEFPTDLVQLPAGAVAIVEVPADARLDGALLVDLPALAARIQSGVGERAAANEPYAFATRLHVEVRREATIRKVRVHIVASGAAVRDPVAAPSETLAEVVIGGRPYRLGTGLDTIEVENPVGSAVLALQGESLFLLLDSALAVSQGEGAVKVGACPLAMGPFTLGRTTIFGRSIRGWGFARGGFVATGRVEKLPCQRACAGDAMHFTGDGVAEVVDAAHRTFTACHAGAALEVTRVGDGVALRSVGDGLVAGFGPLGRFPLGAGLATEVQPFEIERVDLGGKRLDVHQATGMPRARTSRTVRQVPAGATPPVGDVVGMDRRMRAGSHWVNVGTLLEAPGVRRLLKVGVADARVNGRPTLIGDVVPVEREFTLGLAGFVLHFAA